MVMLMLGIDPELQSSTAFFNATSRYTD